jgi:archaellum component FlaC
MADGSIRVPTEIDLTGLRKGLAEMRKELAQAEKEYHALESQYEKGMAEFQKTINKGGKEGAIAQKQQEKYAKMMLENIGAAERKVEAYKKKLAEATSYYDRFSGATDASKQVDQAMANDKLVSSITTRKQYNSLLAQTKAEMAAMEAHASRISAQTGASVDDILRQNEAYRDAANKAQLLETRSKDINRNIRKTTKELKKVNKEIGDSTKRGIAGFGRMQLTMMAVMFAMRAISSATQEYMAVNSKLEGQLNTLKALWGQILGPVIQWVVNLLIQAIGAVNGFVYALTGINFVAKANAAALQKQAKATTSAAKAAQLAGFDEQTKLTDPTAGSSGDPVELLDSTVGALSGFAEKLKNQILAGDWFGAGQTVGKGLMDGIASIDWSGVGTTIGEIMWGAVAFMFGFALSLDAETVLTAANNLLTSFFNAMLVGIQGFDWFTFGRDLVDFLIDAIVIALSMSNIALAILALILSPGGKEMAKSASEFIGSVVGALASALVGMGERIGELANQLWTSIKTYFDEYVDWSDTPGNIIEGLYNGIKDAILGIGDWLYNNVWIPFRDGFKEAFDIHSPSKKMEGFGGDIIDGLYNGIIGGLNKIRQACTDIWNAIKGVFSSVGTWFETKFSNAWQRVKNVFSKGGKIFDGIKEGIASTFKTIVNGLITGINKVISVPFNTINSLLNTIRNIEILEIKPFKGLWSKNPLAVPQIPKLARGGIVNNPGRGVPAIIGEAGAEAVLPLENNTEWMDILADKIGGNVTIPIYMDGKKIATYVVDIQKKKAFAMNGA